MFQHSLAVDIILIKLMSQEIKDFAAGVISGWTQVLIMQPFEIIKVRLQTQNSLKPEYQGIADCLKKTVKQEGLAALYKGTLSPLIGVGFQVSVQFGLNELCKRYFQRFKTDLEFLLPMPYVAASGFVAGVGSGLVAVILELCRHLSSTQESGSRSKRGTASYTQVRLMRPRKYYPLMESKVCTLDSLPVSSENPSVQLCTLQGMNSLCGSS